MAYFHPSAVVDDGATVGVGTKVWHFCHVSAGAHVGRDCVLGQNVFVADEVFVGDRVRIQNNVSLYTGVVVEDDVFLGPSCVLTNISNPRAQLARKGLYEKTLIRRGASIGANATIVCGTTIGRYAFVGAGAVVSKDVPDYALMLGVPARRVGWMSRHGQRLVAGDEGVLVCPESGLRYQEVAMEQLRCLDVDEDEPLPEETKKNLVSYGEMRARRKGGEGER